MTASVKSGDVSVLMRTSTSGNMETYFDSIWLRCSAEVDFRDPMTRGPVGLPTSSTARRAFDLKIYLPSILSYRVTITTIIWTFLR